MQIADVQATLAKAAANCGTLMNTRFTQQIEGMPASSSHFTDPDGNLIEVL
jgi:predicted enzyme related to lactoylglutathione lyase